MDTLIEFSDVRYSYGGSDGQETVSVLEHFNLSVGKGEFIAVLGHNGSGKSTMAKLCNGLYAPLSGKVTVGGLDTSKEENLLHVRQRVGMVFQNPDNQIVATVVEEDVAFALENLGVPPPEIRRRVDEALEIVGMTEYKEHAPHKLSGGQKQRVAIAGVIAMRPECIVMDEPTAMLDPEGRREVLETIGRLNSEQGITVLLITHHMEEAARASRIIVLDKGKIIMDGTPGDVYSQYDRLRKTGLSIPQTVELTRRAGLPPALNAEDCAEALFEWLYPKEIRAKLAE